MARRANGGSTQPAATGDLVPGLYRSVADYHRLEIDRLNSLDDIVYKDLQAREGPVHRRWLTALRNGEPVVIPAWAITDFDDGAAHLGEWVREPYGMLLVWPDDRVTPVTETPGKAYVDPCVWRASWEAAGHVQGAKAAK